MGLTTFDLPHAAPRPALGRIVIAVLAGVKHPAIVTHVYDDGFSIDCTVFERNQTVPTQGLNFGPGASFGWHWPERV